MTSLPSIAAALAAELRRLPCRVSHGPAEVQVCPRCSALAEWDAFAAIVQVPRTVAAEALRERADVPGERYD